MMAQFLETTDDSREARYLSSSAGVITQPLDTTPSVIETAVPAVQQCAPVNVPMLICTVLLLLIGSALVTVLLMWATKL